MTEDPKISQRYRELPREEPPRHVDEAILAAARRAGRSRPAPLVVPSGRRRWYFPLAAAAIIVLAVAVTIQVEREQPDPEAVVSAPPASTPPAKESSSPSEPPAATQSKPVEKREVFTPDPKPAPDAAQRADLEKAQTDAVGGVRESQQAKAALRARAETAPGSNFAAASPEQWLQGIADLRRQGRDDEADRQLAEFRKRYPDYRISEAILEKVEKK